MSEDDQDQITSEKILEAAEQIKDMARDRPAEAAEMLERARYLADLAEQIKRDWQQRSGVTQMRSMAGISSVRPSQAGAAVRERPGSWLIAGPEPFLED